jgi:hypothetical protein
MQLVAARLPAHSCPMAEPATLSIERRVWLASPQGVFDVLKDPTNWFVLDKALVDVSPRDPIVAGAAGTMRHHRGPGMNVTTSWENVAFEPGVQLDNRVIGPGYQLRESVSLESARGGTQMTVVDSVVSTSLVGRLMIAFSRRIMEGDLRARCANLKRLVETASAEN